MLPDLQIYTLAIVLIGEFNPVIISPFWLSGKKLIREEEAHNAKVEILHNDISKFEIEWAKIEVTKNRFEVRTSQENSFEPIKDLAISIFEILKETPITAVGINHLKYYGLNEANVYYQVGNKLAPLDNWKDVIQDPRMMLLEIIEQKRSDGLKGAFRIRVMPSDKLLSTPFGILIHVNDEIGLQTSESGRNREIIKHLANNWKTSKERTSKVIEHIWSKTI